ncbi:substrate-binding periplasmic protein [Vibrio viridaestus]|uniref:Solute-binding protein family 3/N-terminal domain-containing protein n=1 Tax=Vibrio viridaestus TaxID=2487322 RepID=A0A3N9TFR0_9VIBR|nr:transporter substrate-binding domain-containing protein [Vibrio viridaestus]RQW62734.1 hypothetical protein EES38_13490 [Vibrio viridaestus]
MKFGFLSSQLLLLCLFFTSGSKASEPLVFYAVDYPPYLIVDLEKNTISGVDIEVVRAAFSEMGQPVTFKVLPWKRILKLMKAGEIAGTMSCSIRQSRKSFMYFSDPISAPRQVAITLKSTDTTEISKLDDLKHFSVVAVDGWGVQTQLKDANIPHDLTKDLRSGLISIAYRGIDVFYGPENPVFYQAKSMGLFKDIKATYLDDVGPLHLHLCVSQNYPHSSEIIKTFNQGLRKIKNNGHYQKIRAKYFGYSESTL